MDHWHFPRPELAAHYLEVLALGITSNLAIIAPRRKGKTLFVLQDLAPLAQRSQYVPVYASLWQNTNAPQEGLLLALDEAIDAIGQGMKWKSLLQTKIKKTAVSNELLGKMEVEFADQPVKPSSQDLTLLEKRLGELEKKVAPKTVLLLIDEVQHLATNAAFEPLAHTLRTMLDKRQGRVKSIFTGSSRHYMNLLFNASASPFYHFVDTVPFPDLDEKFLGFLRTRLAEEHNMPVALPALKKAFSELDHSPYWMMKLITRLIAFKLSVDAALEHVMRLMEAAEGYEQIAKKLKPIDRLVFLALCADENPFSQTLLARIERDTAVKGIPANVQRALQRLTHANLISQIHKGEYYIEKPGLKHYLSTASG